MRRLAWSILASIGGATLSVFLALQSGSYSSWPWSAHTGPGNAAYVVGGMFPMAVVGFCVRWFTWRKTPTNP